MIIPQDAEDRRTSSALAFEQEGEILARVVRFKEQEPAGRSRPHTEVECGYSILDASVGRIVQLDTYGSELREIPGKVSQSLQFDKNGAAQLVAILRRAFPDLK